MLKYKEDLLLIDEKGKKLPLNATENVSISGKIICEDILVRGSLYVEKSIFAQDVKVDQIVECKGVLHIHNIVAGVLSIYKRIDCNHLIAISLYCRESVECYSCEVKNLIDVKSIFAYRGEIKTKTLICAEKAEAFKDIIIEEECYSSIIKCERLFVNGNLLSDFIYCSQCYVKGSISVETLYSTGDIYCGGSFNGKIVGGGTLHKNFTMWESIQ